MIPVMKLVTLLFAFCKDYTGLPFLLFTACITVLATLCLCSESPLLTLASDNTTHFTVSPSRNVREILADVTHR